MALPKSADPRPREWPDTIVRRWILRDDAGGERVDLGSTMPSFTGLSIGLRERAYF
jgi:hypothetical protein